MTALPNNTMTSDEFMLWAEAQPESRYELVDGRIVAQASEQLQHTDTKEAAVQALRRAIRRSGVPCFAVMEGPAVRIDAASNYKPDGLVYCGERHPGHVREIPNPVVVIEVLSPSTADIDHGDKVAGYFKVPSIEHYLILHPERQTLVHHRRGTAGDVLTRILHAGPLKLDPPGIEPDIVEMFTLQ